MNLFTRAFTSVKRRVSKTVILLILVFVLGNIIAGAISIGQAVENTDKSIRKQLGGYVTAEMDYEALMKENRLGNATIPNIKPDQIDKIGMLSYVKYYDYTSMGSLESKELKRYQTKNKDGSSYDVISSVGSENTYFTVKGIQNNEILDLKENKSKLVDGRTFTKEEITLGSYVCVVSNKLAETNNLKVGSKIKLATNVYDYSIAVPLEGYATLDIKSEPTILAAKDYEFEIIGIFETQSTVKEDENGEMIFDFLDQELQNQIYTSNKVVQSVQQFQNEEHLKKYPEDAEKMGNTEYYTPVFVLNDPLELEDFKEEAKEFLPQYYRFSDNTESYNSVLGPIETIRWIAGVILYVAIGTTVVIISLLITLFLRDRKHEIGIYLSLGERRKNVIIQIVSEVIIVSFIGITLAVFSGNILAGVISEKMLENQIVAEELNNNGGNGIIMERKAAVSVSYYVGNNTGYGQDVTTQDLLEQYNVSLNIKAILMFYLIGLGTILISTVVPMIYIMRLNPKKILM